MLPRGSLASLPKRYVLCEERAEKSMVEEGFLNNFYARALAKRVKKTVRSSKLFMMLNLTKIYLENVILRKPSKKQSFYLSYKSNPRT